MSDIVQVIDRAIELAELTNSKCQGVNGCFKCSQRTTDMAQLGALRGQIVEDRKAFLELGRASAVFSDSTGFTITLTDKVKARDSVATERALLAFCREVVGT